MAAKDSGMNGIPHKWVVLPLLFSLFFTPGCGLISDAARASREEKHAVEKGQVLTGADGLYTIAVPDEFMSAYPNQTRKGAWTISYRDWRGLYQGPYHAVPIPTLELSRAASEDLNIALDEVLFLRMKNRDPKRFAAMKILDRRFTTVENRDAVSCEFLVAGDIRGDVIHRPHSLACVTLIRMADHHLLTTYADSMPFELKPIESIDVEKHMRQVRDDFQRFLSGLTLAKPNGP